MFIFKQHKCWFYGERSVESQHERNSCPYISIFNALKEPGTRIIRVSPGRGLGPPGPPGQSASGRSSSSSAGSVGVRRADGRFGRVPAAPLKPLPQPQSHQEGDGEATEELPGGQEVRECLSQTLRLNRQRSEFIPVTFIHSS